MQQATSLDVHASTPALPAAQARVARLIGLWLEAEHRRFALWLPVALACGVLAYFDLDREPPWWLGSAIAAGGLSFALVPWREPVVRALGLLPFAFGLGFAACSLATHRALPLAILPHHAVVLTGRVQAIEPLPDGSRITIAHPSLSGAPPLARRLRVRLRRNDPIVLRPGDLVRVRALV